MEEFPDEILEIIFSLIPLKPRMILKLVSRNWHNVVTRIRTNSSYGLVMESEDIDIDIENGAKIGITSLISVQDKGKEAIPLDSLKVTFPGLRLLGSSNGLLLYGRKPDLSYDYYKEFMVYSPITKQRVWVPMIRSCEIPQDAFTGFVFDELKGHFKITCFMILAYTCLVWTYSSETCQWDKLLKKLTFTHFCYFFSSRIEEIEDRHMISFTYDHEKKMCFKVKDTRLLTVYDIEKQSFEEIIPPANNTRTVAFSWAEPEGKVYRSCYYESRRTMEICVRHEDGTWKEPQHIISDWCAAMDGKIPNSRIPSDWLLAESELYEPRPVSFNADLQTLYIQLHCMLLAYSLETKTLSLVWFDPRHPYKYASSKIFSFLFKPVDMSHLGLQIQLDN